MAVTLEQHPTGDMNTPFLFQSLLHLGNGLHWGFDDPFHFCRLREGFGDKGGKPLEPGFGLLHISQIANERVNQVSDYLKEGQQVRVKVIEADEKGRVRLSMKALLKDEAAQA